MVTSALWMPLTLAYLKSPSQAPCPLVPIWKRTSVLGTTTGHQRLVLTWALDMSPMG